jgi:hypothetical protein
VHTAVPGKIVAGPAGHGADKGGQDGKGVGGLQFFGCDQSEQQCAGEARQRRQQQAKNDQYDETRTNIPELTQHDPAPDSPLLSSQFPPVGLRECLYLYF